jgi:hypothetical protein
MFDNVGGQGRNRTADASLFRASVHTTELLIPFDFTFKFALISAIFLE